MIMVRVLFVAAFTSRSQAYAQGIANAGLFPGNVLFLGVPKQGIAGQGSIEQGVDEVQGLFIPDFSKGLEETVDQWDSKIYRVNENNINSQEVYNYINKLKPELIIYSGYGGQVVEKRVLDIGSPFLHMHSGWLPDYRGSTTLYYGWLDKRLCAVSAIILKEKIDIGPIVARKKFDIPPENIDPDYVYDSAIRADTLVSVLIEYMRNGCFKNIINQADGVSPYYVMHPLLKHIARLSTKKRRQNDTGFQAIL